MQNLAKTLDLPEATESVVGKLKVIYSGALENTEKHLNRSRLDQIIECFAGENELSSEKLSAEVLKILREDKQMLSVWQKYLKI